MAHLQYLILMALCLVVTLPLEILGARVWRQPLRLVITVAEVALLFSLFDALSIKQGLWTYARRYTTGIKIAGVLPIEELAFFIVIPICALLTFETVQHRHQIITRFRRRRD
ncbi:lycopene cyclase domain-containing protein [Ferrimicrobium sp.]|uniref:lycopene cyclase domain-containing protein n=1 Tax=Ferrimicrobium sp. TaxID=2926050 RepID=UPI00263790CE|nr:lycopene cyclase domain-containing protein [Ferrimicrobium sp.]